MKKNFKLIMVTLVVNLLIGNLIIDRSRDSDGLREQIIYSAVAIALLLGAFTGKKKFRSPLYDILASVLISALVPVLGTGIYAGVVNSSPLLGAGLGAVGGLLLWQYCMAMAILNFLALRFYSYK